MATHSSAEAIPLGQNRSSHAGLRMPLADRLNTLIDQIAGLAEEAGGSPLAPPGMAVGASATAAPPASLADLARRFYSQRRRRARHLPDGLFGEPAWDILLDLFIAAEEGRRIPVTSACIAADVPATTGLRWLQVLENQGLVERRADPADGRRTHVALSMAGYTAMANCMAAEVRTGGSK